MIYEIPFTFETPHYQFTIELDGADFVLDLYWNARQETWSLSVFDVDGNPVAEGRTVVTGSSLAGRALPPAGPQGILFSLEIDGQAVDLLYADHEEIVA